ncbi:hypothetical protein F5Y16DRAFT_131505 [Xylariaceae sp. FL0255]|nr:hypothetical protein F5Y16DRAFT_131505 [Xylariaceae sp. FL0255]
MDDLSGLDWSSNNNRTASQGASKPPAMSPPSFYPSLRPTPSPQVSGRSTPLSAQLSANSKPPATKPAVDSFSNLVNFGGAKSNNNNTNLSLKQRQEQLAAEKRQKEEEQKKTLQSQYGGGQFWDTLGQSSSRTASPAIPPPTATNNDDDDLFAAFNKNTRVDNSSHYPPPPAQVQSRTSTPASTAQLDLSKASAWNKPLASNQGFDDDDDPFGLNQMRQNSGVASTNPISQPMNDDDDFLGDLGRPVEEVRQKARLAESQRQPAARPAEESDSSSDDDFDVSTRRPGSDPFDKAVAELVDMGFTAENARRALTESGAGLNVQAAVSWLLDDAHRQARNKQNSGELSNGRNGRDDSRPRDSRGPARIRHEEGDDIPSRNNTPSPAYADDIQKKAAAVGSSFLKTANSLWKTGQKQVQKAVADFQQDGGDPNQPKWMRAAQSQDRAQNGRREAPGATDEAMMLESGGRPSRSRHESPLDQSRALPTRGAGQSAVPKWQQNVQPSLADPRARLSKQASEEQSAQAYVSPARRKKTTPQPEPEADLLFGTTSSAPPPIQKIPQRSAQPSPAARSSPSAFSKPSTPRPRPPTRNIPSVPPAVLQASTRHRTEGTAHVKRGDYDAAHTSYTNSLSGIPQSHPLCIIILTERALTSLKTGSPKQAVSDADAAIGIIGTSRGEGEKVTLPEGESRDMKDLYGKALSRKAEALEEMEKWSDANLVWQQCIEAGVGGANATAGRQRCQKALAPKPKTTPRPTAAKPRPKPSAMAAFAPPKNSEAVERLREANKAAEAADDEKFALSEKVDARIASWRDGKRDNLRALLGSMDQVLWENSGWKKVGLHELVMANKVKIHYMKAIAKCHPDKLPQNASTEVQLIAATVFATLNESWDKFKADNGL